MGYKRGEGSRARIVEAAGSLFARRGYYEVVMGDIAAEAGMGRASVYYHFKDKEAIARAYFDSVAARIYAAAESLAPASGDLLLRTLVIYIMLFKHIALNKATRVVYYDLVRYEDYDAANIERLELTFYRDFKRLAAAYGATLSDERVAATIVTSDALAKALFKGIMNGVLGFSLEEATDYFCRRSLLCDVPVPEEEYQRKLKEAFALCERELPEEDGAADGD